LRVGCDRSLEMNLGRLGYGVNRSCCSCRCKHCGDWGGSNCSIHSPSSCVALSLGLALHPPLPAKFVKTSLGSTLQQQYASPHAHRHFPRFQRRIHTASYSLADLYQRPDEALQLLRVGGGDALEATSFDLHCQCKLVGRLEWRMQGAHFVPDQCVTIFHCGKDRSRTAGSPGTTCRSFRCSCAASKAVGRVQGVWRGKCRVCGGESARTASR
jgi:hypothetical protein